ncbi:MAG: putative non-specific protein-Tyrosine kinase, partial [Rhodospirillaceae bacterium]
LLLVTMLVLYQLTPRFTAEALVAIETRKIRTSSIDEVVSGISTDLATLQTEATIIRSRNLSEKVVEELELVNNPEFNSTLACRNQGLAYRRSIRGAPLLPGRRRPTRP